jgi:prepilin-type N-terminal cleavage/methylation domain-containing protein
MISLPALSSNVRQKGFTLFEIMVTVLLAGLMMTGAFYFLIDFTRSWDQDTSDLELQRQGTYALTVMEARLRQCDRFTISAPGPVTGNKLTVTIPNPPAGTRSIDYYQNGTAIEENDVQTSTVTTIIPDTHVAGIQVSALTFTDEIITGQPGQSVRIDLALRDASGQTAAFTASARLRNQDVE